MPHEARITRFAPSPTGLLHLGHAFSALIAAGRGDTFLLRLEDIDTARCKPAFEGSIYDDLRWLGLTWPSPVWRQSDRLYHYTSALARLSAMGLTYPCRCSRADIRAALSAPQEGAPIGPDGPLYPGTCRNRTMADAQPTDAIRLDIARASALTGPVTFTDTGPGYSQRVHQMTPSDMAHSIGDIVLARRDIGTSYHIAVVVDDAAQGITEVTRGADLFAATFIHVLLQRLLALPTPAYHHHRLIRDDEGKRLAKRDAARAIRSYRDAGATPSDIRDLLNLPSAP
ncbi:tRNA glutamyl-Q(34) synthetase GluQRS [Roseicitreum antarcticum]|uniref:Glutamyl-Q tRNA(Asp) synthetase n=1 Tax=Roseicitreum antarcticum TaxID=564137 RepID=A0A1H3CGZ4_9RHOB|nr:tRNA glutamyl-Q(34) synthetase GluQRS [Roseicitreum antarcticum]SDX53393.1 glutamyl-Q tRNA(Asp) synthetase [Roseicitreum antarcticum]